MAEPLKRFFDRRRVALLGAQVEQAWPAFPRARFEREASQGLDRLELLPRGRHIMEALARALPPEYPDALAVLMRSLGPPLEDPMGNGMEPFHYLPHTMFVAEHGVGHWDLSMQAQKELTKRFSCEGSVRPFIEARPAAALALLQQWTLDPDEHVRRLVSEGTRPRLPWAARLRMFQEDPGPVLALLELLKDDPRAYVRRSVANNLNDISKDHPAVVVEVAGRWLEGARVERRRLVAHGLRTLVKQGHPEAIRLLGGDGEGAFATRGGVAPKEARIGAKVQCTVRVRNDGPEEGTAVLGLRIHFVKASGSTAPKAFRLPTVTLAPGEEKEVGKAISLAQHSTRTHFPGAHRVEVVVNGQPRPLGRFVLRR